METQRGENFKESEAGHVRYGREVHLQQPRGNTLCKFSTCVCLLNCHCNSIKYLLLFPFSR